MYILNTNLAIPQLSKLILNLHRTVHVRNVVRTELDCHTNNMVPMTWRTGLQVYACSIYNTESRTFKETSHRMNNILEGP